MKTAQKMLLSLVTTSSSFFLSTSAALAQNFEGLSNPAIEGELKTTPEAANSGELFATFFINLWNAVMAIGAIFVLVLFIWGAFEWIASGGEKGKVENARNRITQAIVGLVILVGSFVILGYLSTLLFGDSFNILRVSLPEL